MKRLIIWLALLLPFIANAQVNGTIQKTASSGTIRGSFGSLGIDTIPRVTGALVNGYILKYHAATNKWYASPDPTLVGLQDSLTKKANRTFDNVASGAIAKAKADTSSNGLLPKSNLFPLGDTRYAKGVGNAVLTSGNQSVAGTKTYSDAQIINNDLTLSRSTANFTGLNIQSTGSGLGSILYLERPTSTETSRIIYKTGSTGKWEVGSRSASESYKIYNASTLSDALSIDNSTNAITAVGSISSTPQGTLYGTASGSITSAQLATSLTDETGTGNVVFSANPTFTGTIAAAAAGFTGAVNLATSSGNVLIGTTTDDGYKLDVNGTARFSGLVTGNGGFRSTAYQLFQASAQRGGLYTYDAIAGSGTDYNPTFYSEGDLYFATGGTATKKLIISSAGAATFSSSVTATGFFESSDLRYKDILSRAVSKDGFDMISYKWKPELNRDNKVHFGYVAQEVEKVYPDQVQTDEKGFKSVNYIEILVKKISDLEHRIKQLEK